MRPPAKNKTAPGAPGPVPAGFDQAGFERACSLINAERLTGILARLVDVASPTGEEGPLAREIAAILNERDLQGAEQVVAGAQSNALGGIPGAEPDRGASLLLYSPMDTVTSSSAAEDLPWAGPELRPEMLAKSFCEGGHVYGLGAHNPKGHAACIIEAAGVLHEAGIALNGGLLLAFGAGGMPTNPRPGTHQNCGHGAGCRHMLTLGPKPGCAVIAKSGWSISWEEVGLIWFEVSVSGKHNYAGSRHLMPWRNPITDAAKLIAKLDEWLVKWPDTHRSGLVAPQGVISFIESGWERMPAFTPALCRFRLDLRLNPRTTPGQAEREFAQALQSFSRELGIETRYERIIAIPGSCTDPLEPVIRWAIASWEALEGRPHQPVSGMSGATDANILRAHGVPTARVGLPKARLPNMDFQLGMNAVAIEDLLRLTRLLIHISLNVCNRAGGARADG